MSKLYNEEEPLENPAIVEINDIHWSKEQECSTHFNVSRRQGLIHPEFVNPKCPICQRIIQEINRIFEQDHTSCQDPREYCISHLLEAVHTSLIWRLLNQ